MKKYNNNNNHKYYNLTFNLFEVTTCHINCCIIIHICEGGLLKHSHVHIAIFFSQFYKTNMSVVSLIISLLLIVVVIVISTNFPYMVGKVVVIDILNVKKICCCYTQFNCPNKTRQQLQTESNNNNNNTKE